MRDTRLCETCMVCYALYNPLNRSWSHTERVFDCEVVFQHTPYSCRYRNDSPFGFLSIRTTLAKDDKSSLLPQNVIFLESCKLPDTKSSIKQRKNDELLLESLRRINEPVCFFHAQRFTFVLICHSPSITCVAFPSLLRHYVALHEMPILINTGFLAL